MSLSDDDDPAGHAEDRPTAPPMIRADLKLIADMVTPGSRVLDVGCGDGALLAYLVHTKGVDGRGLELSMDGVKFCVNHGLSVIQGDADTDLRDYPSDAFDYVILSQTLQAMRAPREVLLDLVRIGRRAVVSLPNFGHWRIRAWLLFFGRMPVTQRLGHQWWSTPNIHLCTITDFADLCRELGVIIEDTVILDRFDRVRGHGFGGVANLIAEQAVFLLRRG